MPLFDVVYQFRAYTTKQGYQQLDDVLAEHCRLYNAALQSRRDAWKMGRNSVTYLGLCKELTGLRRDDPAWAAQSRRLATGTLKRLDVAFQGFFRRVAQGENPGYPRFKPRQRFRTLETHGIERSMLKVYPEQDRAAVIVKGLPRLEIKLKGRELPPLADWTTLRIKREGRRVTVSLGFKEEKIPLACTGRAVGLDMRMGVARVVTSDGEFWARREVDSKRVRLLQRRLSRANKQSGNRRKKRRILANAHSREKVRNHNAVHRFTTRVVQEHDLVVVEDLNIVDMVASGRGTIEEPGRLVQVKADLNRRALNQTWGEIRRQLNYKAAWAGRHFIAVDPDNTSRTCSGCGMVAPEAQLNPTFRCGSCGLVGATAHNAAVNILRRGLFAALGEGGSNGLVPPLGTPQNVASIGELSPMRVEIPAHDSG